MKLHYTKPAVILGLLLAVAGFSVGAQAESSLGHGAPSVPAIELVKATRTPDVAQVRNVKPDHELAQANIKESQSGPTPEQCQYGSGTYIPGCPAHGPY
ncbi:MAG: hypothetical protein KGQ58_06990 [Proteobacteria bacterium]|nr:hypothetical protein [Pseudomonadota bacterium]MDE3207576.1 hypothetical protein [Pseudomonadota bacterium]